MKYKVGDKVRVRKDLVGYSSYGGCSFLREMESFIGKVVTIRKVIDEEYTILEDDGEYAWTEEMFEGLAEKMTTAEKIIRENTITLYTWQDLCDYELLLLEKWRIVNEQRQEQYLGHSSIMQTLRGEYLDAIERTIKNLGHDVPENKVKEWGFGEVNNG